MVGVYSDYGESTESAEQVVRWAYCAWGAEHGQREWVRNETAFGWSAGWGILGLERDDFGVTGLRNEELQGGIIRGLCCGEG